jgi:hypothetical protein
VSYLADSASAWRSRGIGEQSLHAAGRRAYGALDTATGNDIMGLFAKLHEQGNTMVLVTHEHDIAMHAHRIIHIRDGRSRRTSGFASPSSFALIRVCLRLWFTSRSRRLRPS